MTDEQIRQNAADYVYNFQPTGVITEDRLKCYIAGAHSRDREVMDLEHLLNVERISNKVIIEANEKLRNPWISVEERLPESQQQCELYDHAGYLRHGFYMAYKKKWIGTPLGCDIPEYVDITH